MSASEPRRLTPTERLHEVTMAAMSRRPAEPEHSVTVSRNAKGVAQFEVTVRGFTIEDVLTEARAAFDILAVAYPYENGSEGTGAAVTASEPRPKGASRVGA